MTPVCASPVACVTRPARQQRGARRVVLRLRYSLPPCERGLGDGCPPRGDRALPGIAAQQPYLRGQEGGRRKRDSERAFGVSTFACPCRWKRRYPLGRVVFPCLRFGGDAGVRVERRRVSGYKVLDRTRELTASRRWGLFLNHVSVRSGVGTHGGVEDTKMCCLLKVVLPPLSPVRVVCHA